MAKPNAVEAVRIALFLTILVLVLVVVLTKPDFLNFGAYDVGDLLQMLAPLVLISLFIERILEVLLSAWRGPEAARLKLDLKQEQDKTDAGETTAFHSKEQRFLAYRSETQKIASASAVALGVVISAVGIHALEMLVDADSFYQLSGFQLAAFQTVDIIVTGAVIGGGAEALHKIIAASAAFMDSAKRRAEGSRV